MGKKSQPKPPKAPDLVSAAKEQGVQNKEAAILGSQLGNVNQQTPYGSLQYTFDPKTNQWSSVASLSPEQQSLYETQTGGALAAGQAGREALERVSPTLGTPLDLYGLPERSGPIAPSDYNRFTGAGPNVQSSLDFSGVGDVPTSGDYGAQKQQVIDSLYGQATRQLDPQFERSQAALETQLANQGLDRGSEAFRNALTDFQTNKGNAYADARDRAIQAGGAEQSRLTADTLAGRGQELSRITAGGQFANAADQQRIDSLVKTLGFDNAAEAAQFADQLAAGQFAGQERQSALGEQAYARQVPFQEALSLYGLGQPQTPTFQSGGAPTVQPTDILGATQANYGNALDLYNAQAQGNAGKKGNMTNLAGAGISAIPWSDRRLKFDIEQIGVVRETGLPVYSYMKFGVPEIGVMADEVRELHPEAVVRDPSGYDRVDYSKIPGTVELQ